MSELLGWTTSWFEFLYWENCLPHFGLPGAPCTSPTGNTSPPVQADSRLQASLDSGSTHRQHSQAGVEEAGWHTGMAGGYCPAE